MCSMQGEQTEAISLICDLDLILPLVRDLCDRVLENATLPLIERFVINACCDIPPGPFRWLCGLLWLGRGR